MESTTGSLTPASILVDRRFRRGKTDRLDVAALLRTLMAFARGEPRVCREVRAPSVEQEDERRRSRERARLVNERGQHLNRIKGLLVTQGVRDFAPARRDWRKRLDGLRTADGWELPPHLRQEIERECRRLWLVAGMIAEVEAEQQQAAKAAETAAIESRAAAQLSRLRGVGPDRRVRGSRQVQERGVIVKSGAAIPWRCPQVMPKALAITRVDHTAAACVLFRPGVLEPPNG